MARLEEDKCDLSADLAEVLALLKDKEQYIRSAVNTHITDLTAALKQACDREEAHGTQLTLFLDCKDSILKSLEEIKRHYDELVAQHQKCAEIKKKYCRVKASLRQAKGREAGLEEARQALEAAEERLSEEGGRWQVEAQSLARQVQQLQRQNAQQQQAIADLRERLVGEYRHRHELTLQQLLLEERLAARE